MGWSQLGVLMLGLCCAAPVVRGQGYVNIAPGKSYDQSSTYDSRYLSRYATDGDTNCNPNFNSKTEINPYWEVDLGRTYPVHNIILWSLSSSTSMYPVNITVDEQHCVTVSSNPTSLRNNSVTCSSVLYGRRLRVTGTGTGRQLAICEIEILVPRGDRRCHEGRWGSQCQHHCTNNCGETTSPNFCYESPRNCYDECVAGRWGDRCQNRCGQNCVTGNCDLETGNCSACIAGWYGEQCNKACPSHSCLLNTCHQKTGRCLACHTGYDGENCTGMKDESSQQSSVPVGSAILGAGLMLTVAVLSVLVFLCWKHRSQKTVQDAETVAASSSDPVTAPNNVYTAPPTASSSISPSASAQAGDVTPHVIRDPGNTYEQLRIYSNMVFDREAHSEPEPRGTDATTALSTSEHVQVSVEHIYANTSSATEERKPRKKKAN